MKNTSFSKASIYILLTILSNCSDLPKETPFLANSKSLEVEHRHLEYSKDVVAFAAHTAAEKTIDIIKYNVEAEYVPSDKATLYVKADIDFRTLGDLNGLSLDTNVAEVFGVSDLAGNALEFIYDRPKKKLGVMFGETQKANTDLSLTIQYKVFANDAEGSGLYLYEPDPKLDPNSTEVLFTKTEPDGTAGWLPSQDRPDDRAAFSIEVKMPRDLSLVSNGLLIKDEFELSLRAMKWETKIPLPTYLMAFAVSNFQVSKQNRDDLEISIWARQGIKADFVALLKETKRQIEVFEKLLVPYPFEKYAIVLIPNFGGGMEHASVTFNAEQSSVVADDHWHKSLMAHELAHHWFGDLITVQNWDDLWIKEGMATLLATEAFRNTEHVAENNGSMGEMFWFEDGDAIIDPLLTGWSKYNSGPYGRAAWLHSQLRSVVGTRNYWKILRTVLRENYFGNISSKTFMAYFKPYMSEMQFDRFENALYAHDIPKIEFSKNLESNKIQLKLVDKESALPTSIDFEIKTTQGKTEFSLGGLSSLDTLEYPIDLNDGIVLMDPLDLHPSIWAFVQGDEKDRADIYQNLISQMIPGNETEWKLWRSDTRYGAVLGGLIFEQGLASYQSALTAPSQLINLYNSTNSEATRTHILALMCEMASLNSESEATLKPIIDSAIRKATLVGNIWWSKYPQDTCAPYSEKLFSEKLALASSSELAVEITDRELLLLRFFPSSDQTEMTTIWKNLKENGNSLMVRSMASRFLTAMEEQ